MSIVVLLLGLELVTGSVEVVPAGRPAMRNGGQCLGGSERHNIPELGLGLFAVGVADAMRRQMRCGLQQERREQIAK